MGRNAIWLRQDLRTADNTALLRACDDQSSDVVAIFLAVSDQWQRQDMAAMRRQYLFTQLGALKDSLDELNIPLIYEEVGDFSSVPQWFEQHADELALSTVFANREYGWNEKCRDDKVAQVLSTRGIGFKRYHDQTIIPPGLKTIGGTPYTVYTPYKKKWISLFDNQRHLPHGSPSPRQKNAEPSFKGTALPKVPAVTAWPAGENAARRKLNAYCDEKISRYAKDRDLPAVSGTSSLSAELSAGVLSTRQCLSVAMGANMGMLQSGEDGADTWISELIWRDFYIHILDSFPDVSKHRAFRKETEYLNWRNSSSDFEAWCQGRTGIPIVDAAMRQLTTTGWMHNRLRMICAMFLSKQLLIDWRRGEQFFMQHLIDGHLASNNGGWQWAASTGTDAAPYFRIFNPVTQSKRFDPEGNFIRQYLPELAPLKSSAIHLPTSADLTAFGIDYPAPIVDLATARIRALEAFKALPRVSDIQTD